MSICKEFEIKVTIKEELKKSLIFGLPARLPAAVILGFLGWRHEVMAIMQNLSHQTRAYICNADALLGFVDQIDILKVLKDADKKGLLSRAKFW